MFNWFYSITRSRRAMGALVLVMALLAPVVMLPSSVLAARGTDATGAQQTFTLTLRRGLGHADDLQSIEIERGKTILLNTTFAVSRLAVGDPDIADFVAISEREIEIIAKNVGDTNLLVWGENGRLQAVVDLHIASLQPHVVRELTRLLDNPGIHVDVAGGSVILRGNVPTLEAYEHAGRIAEAYLTRAKKVISGQDISERPDVINLLEVGGGHQVMIEIVIAELSRNIRRAFGVNLMGKVTSGDTQAATFQTMLKNLTSNPELFVAPGTPAGMTAISDNITLAGSYFQSESMDLRIFLEAVEANQVGKILAEPTVVARSGETADFLVGGEVPIPLVTNFGTGGSNYSIQFKRFGVNVEFTPTVMSEDRIHLKISPEVSEPDFSIGVRVLGQSVPAFRTRRVTTGIELGNGESFVLAGLLREDILGDVEDLPFLSDVPILGQLFRSRAFQKTQTELVLIATPRLVQPVAAGTKIELPTDHYIEPSLLEFYWDGRIEGRAPKDDSQETAGEAASTDVLAGGMPGNPLLADDGIDLVEEASDGASGGFMGTFGYRVKSPQPKGGIE